MRSALLAALLLAGCETMPQSVTVRVPVPVPCIDAPLAGPRYTPDAELRAMSDAQFVLALAADRYDLIAWSEEAQAVMRACVGR